MTAARDTIPTGSPSTPRRGEIAGSHLLVAAGPRSAVAGLGREAAGIEAPPAGIVADARLRTTNWRVFAIGDVTGGAGFTHVAACQAGVVLRAALCAPPARARADHIPRAIDTTPELARVGITETEARGAHGVRVEVCALKWPTMTAPSPVSARPGS